MQTTPPRAANGGTSAVFFIAVTLLFALALFSFTPADITSFSTDLQGRHYPANLLGLLGARCIWTLLLTLGLGVHALFGLLCVCTVRRLFSHGTLRPLSWEYFPALGLFTVCASLLAATWHDHFAATAAELNLATLAGGVLGDAFCGPSGCLLYILSRPGISLLMGVIMLAMLYYVYWHDWHPLVCALRSERQAARERGDHQDGDGAGAPAAPRPQPAPAPRAAAIQPELPLQFGTAAEEAPPRPAAPARKPSPAPSPRPAPSASAAPADAGSYVLPPTDLLETRVSDEQSAASAKEIQLNRQKLQSVLDAFNIEGTVVDAVHGPQVTLFKIKVEPHVRVERITSLEHNICMDLASTRIRILTPIPNESLIGIEVPNTVLQSVSIRGMMEEKQWQTCTQQLPLLLGKNISGRTICIDLARAPHLLIAGATGTGKSVCMNMVIVSLLYKHTPETLRLIMVDPKKVEFSIYRRLPHLLVPVITDNSKVSLALKWACNEMTRRYQMLSAVNARDIATYNQNRDRNPDFADPDGNPLPPTLPYIVIIIDELADIMLTSKAEVEDSIARLAALARAVGIHVIIATQRPDTKVITGTIKNNFPARISFQVPSHIDSQTIIGQKGAERLLGRGDMLYKPSGGELERIQGGMASDEERNAVVEFITAHSPAPQFDESVLRDENGNADLDDDDPTAPRAAAGAQTPPDGPSLFERAVDIILHDRKASISYLQRRLGIGYNKSASLVEELEREGIIGPKVGTGNAEILITEEEWRQRQAGAAPRTPPRDGDAADDDSDGGAPSLPSSESPTPPPDTTSTHA